MIGYLAFSLFFLFSFHSFLHLLLQYKISSRHLSRFLRRVISFLHCLQILVGREDLFHFRLLDDIYWSICKGIKPCFSKYFFALNRLSLSNHRVWWRSFELKVRCFAACLMDWVEVYCMIVPSSCITGSPLIFVMIKYVCLLFCILCEWRNKCLTLFVYKI